MRQPRDDDFSRPILSFRPFPRITPTTTTTTTFLHHVSFSGRSKSRIHGERERERAHAGAFFSSPLRLPIPSAPPPFHARDLVRQRHLQTPLPVLLNRPSFPRQINRYGDPFSLSFPLVCPRLNTQRVTWSQFVSIGGEIEVNRISSCVICCLRAA